MVEENIESEAIMTNDGKIVDLGQFLMSAIESLHTEAKSARNLKKAELLGQAEYLEDFLTFIFNDVRIHGKESGKTLRVKQLMAVVEETNEETQTTSN